MKTKYYTPDTVANLLVSRIPPIEPGCIADVCAGSGNLLLAARRRWPKAKAIAVDIDPSTRKHFVSEEGIFWTMGDGRQKVFEKELFGRCDVVLANPPFAKSDTPPPRKLDDVVCSLKKAYKRIINRLDASMIVANLSLLAPNGYLALILPNGLLNAVGWQPLREYIVTHFRIIEVIDLPRVFRSAEVASSIVIIKKQHPSRRFWTKMSAAFFRYDRLSVCMSKNIASEKLTERMDAKYFLNENSSRMKRKFFVRDLPIGVGRGAYSPSKANLKREIRIVHSTNVTCNCELGGMPLFLKQNDLTKGTKTESRVGDIVFVRVGKTVGRVGIIGKNEQGALISDCLFMIRFANGYSPKILFNYLMSTEAKNYFNRVSRGTGARYVTKQDLLSLPIPMYVAKYYDTKT